tara:strand:+ start:222 stop:650 length:429 start_codon:yes stop_codon:yes gene_type:complete
MSFNRLIYDNCAYEHQLHENVGTLAYVMDPSKFEHCSKCRMELGILGGANVSHIKGNLVDLESDLRGTTRIQSKCPDLKYQNPCPKQDMNSCQPKQIVIKASPSNSGRVINTNLQHLPSCQMINYNPIPLPPALNINRCPNK